MKRLVLSLVAAALVSACSSAPMWDTSVFPNQVMYGASQSSQPAEAKK